MYLNRAPFEMTCREKLLTTYKEVPIKKVMIVYLPLIGGLDRIEPGKHCVYNTASQKEEKFRPEVYTARAPLLAAACIFFTPFFTVVYNQEWF